MVNSLKTQKKKYWIRFGEVSLLLVIDETTAAGILSSHCVAERRDHDKEYKIRYDMRISGSLPGICDS